jgi:hypothetical protein
MKGWIMMDPRSDYARIAIRPRKKDTFVRNQVNLAQEPEQVFLNPQTDEGVTFLSDPPYFWRAIAPTLIVGVGASES